METNAHKHTVLTNAQSEEIGAPPRSRRGFLRQAAAAGVTSAAMAVLVEGAGGGRAEASRNGEMIVAAYYGLEVVDGRYVRLYSKTDPNFDKIEGMDPSGSVSFQIPIGAIDVQKTPVFGAWYTPYESVKNLSQFDLIDLGLNGDRTALVLNVRPAAGVTSTSTVIQTFVLHEVR